MENIKSFFQQEETLMKSPNEVPVTASEALGKPRITGVINNPNDINSKIIDKHLPEPVVNNKTDKKLPFSAAQLRAALPKSETTRESETTKKQEKEQENKSNISKSKYSEPAISYDDIKAFEEAITNVAPDSIYYQDDGEDNKLGFNDEFKNNKSSLNKRKIMTNGFFSNFQDFIKDNPEEIDESILSGDLVHKMRLFHERRNDGKEPFMHSKDAGEAIKRKLNELQMLEYEWHSKFTEMKHAERSLINLEEEIDERTQNLKQLLKTTKQLSLVGKNVDEVQGFRLSNGGVITSISGLRHALAKMDSLTFSNHIDLRTNRNDFAQWILDVFNDQALAKAITETHTKDELIRVLSKFGFD